MSPGKLGFRTRLPDGEILPLPLPKIVNVFVTVKLVTVAGTGVLPPMIMLSIVPVVCGFIVTYPLAVGANVMIASVPLAVRLLSTTALLAVKRPSTPTPPCTQRAPVVWLLLGVVLLNRSWPK